MVLGQFRRFLTVGITNAIIHFSVLNICFSVFEFTPLSSSIVATLFAMTYSFILNRKFVFKSSNEIKREVITFTIITACGVLIVHNLVYVIFIYILQHSISVVSVVEETINYRISQDSVVINIATVAGAIAAMIWNYNGYRLFVFRNTEVRKSFEKATD